MDATGLRAAALRAMIVRSGSAGRADLPGHQVGTFDFVGFFLVTSVGRR
jgi:hypothetical protein